MIYAHGQTYFFQYEEDILKQQVQNTQLTKALDEQSQKNTQLMSQVRLKTRNIIHTKYKIITNKCFFFILNNLS